MKDIFVQIGLLDTIETVDFLQEELLAEMRDVKTHQAHLLNRNMMFVLPPEIADLVLNPYVVGVDSNPESIAFCRTKYPNENLKLLQYLISDKNETMEVKRWAAKYNARLPSEFTSNLHETDDIQVESIILSKLFDIVLENTHDKIRGLFLDIEGYEVDVLRGHDWKIKPDYIGVEAHTPYLARKCLQILFEHGYVLLSSYAGYIRGKQLLCDTFLRVVHESLIVPNRDWGKDE